MATATLPSNLHAKLTALARRMALLRFTRRAAGLVVLLALTAGLILLADHWLKFPGAIRFLMLAAWGALAVWCIVKCIRSLGIQADVDALAALIESEYPNLAERLTTSVELAEAPDGGHGSPALIELLLKETEIRASKLDFLQAAPERSTYERTFVALAALALLLGPAFVWPHSYRTELSRIMMPWTKPALSYEIVANPGDVAVARMQPLTLSAVVQTSEGYDEIPKTATLVVTDPSGKSDRFAMRSDQPLVYYFKLARVVDGFHYHVESGEAIGRDFEVIAVDPVQLAADSPTITVSPPAYAKKDVETKTFVGLTDFSALQYGKVVFDFRFSRPAVSARLNWTSDAKEEHSPTPTQYDLALGDGRTSARLELPVSGSGRFGLVLEAEHEIKAEMPQLSLNVVIDHAPAFQKVSGVTEQARTVSMNETISLDITAADDFEVATADVEYKVNDGAVQVEPIALGGLGTSLANGKHVLKLAGKVKEGDSFQYRLRIADNRNVPEAKLGPNVVYLPDDKTWYTFKIARNAEPLKEQEIRAQRDDIRKRLDALIRDLEKEENSIYARQQEARRNLPVRGDDEEKMQTLRSAHQENERTLHELARDTSATRELQSLANRMQDVADQEMRNANAALQAAEKARNSAAVRSQELTKGDDQIKSAINRLEELKASNDKIAQQRLDQMKLDQLAEKQQQLADKVEKETDPKTAKELAKEQQRLSDELKRLTEQSDPLRQSLDQAQAEKNQELADKARELAEKQRELSQSIEQTNKEQMKNLLADLARKQRELANEVAKLAKDTENSRKAAQTPSLDAAKPKEAADALDKGDPNSALTKQEQTIQDLERLEKDLDSAIKLARDPREAAHQLMRLQEELKKRTNAEAAKTPLDKMPADTLNDLHKDQQAIKNAAEKLSVPEDNSKAKEEKLQAQQHAQKAAEHLLEKDQKGAEGEMAEAKDALERLMKSLPTLDERLANAREEVNKLRRKQDDVSRQAESIAREAEANPANTEQARRDLAQKLADSVRKQAQIADKLEKLDIPTLEERQARTQDSLNKALQDLQRPHAQDVPASQVDARRQLERLEQALDKKTPVDEKAAELARQQKQIANQAAKLARENPSSEDQAKDMKDLQNQQHRLAKELAGLPQTEAPQRQSEAADAVKKAEQAADKNPAELSRGANDAAQALQRLADQLNGNESDAQKADRLAKRQSELANDAKSNKDDLRKKQQQIQDEAKQLRGGDEAAKEKKQADEALARLNRSQAEKPAEARKQAADALHDLADKLARDDAARKSGDQNKLANQTEKSQPNNSDTAKQQQSPIMPSRAQTDQARQLAQQQRELRDAVAKATEAAQNQQPMNNPVGDLAKEQKSIAQAAQQLAQQQAQQNGKQSPQAQQSQQAAQAAQQASNHLQSGALPQAKESGQQAAQQMQQMAQGNKGDAADRARQLAQRQEAVNRQLEQMANNSQAQNAQQLAAQRDLQQQAQQLGQQMQQQAGQMRQSPGQQAMQQAANASQQANRSMQQAQQGNPASNRQARQDAARNLDRASQLAQQAAQQGNNGQQQQGSQQTGKALQQAQNQMGQAKQQLGQGKPQSAQGSMQQAAQSLQQAAQSMSQQGQQNGQPPNGPTNGTGNDGSGHAALDLSKYGDDAKKFQGKPWGELPGELRTRIIQDLKAQYGDDYGRMIKLYFEQLADKKSADSAK